ncbi:DUF309 domain-containing protein [Staphylococcus edaphicus]|uniref:DUF309 domain-containing protein n=1 Tax=Staphylococcus edaphicus TaxID=1955013 RepID=A0A2C6WJH7_9STAP|nr:DUF309 domain-containing protein [Staphylococcus edaphicus]PHK49250.1 hypothetical protein BTJ66_09540 [Staphylococcus edaphicus]UQW80373.1 DUF309 domain-containing protein [Staphylococcus edaphicus]
MENALKDFYFQFHTKQHYFLCHDILEEAWKENEAFSKEDAVVSLILFATGCYHYRRGNTKGAIKSFRKALKVIEPYNENVNLGINITAYQKLILELIAAIENDNPFVPVQLPLTSEMQQNILTTYPQFVMTEYVVKDSYIVNHHLERNRTEVTEARLKALYQKQQERR